MGIRETLNQNPGLTTGATAGIIILALGFIIWSNFSDSEGGSAPSKLYYTDDDGATFFPDDIRKFPPFDHGGKPAVRARVFSCDGGKTKFVGYLERYTPDAKARLEKAGAGKPGSAADVGIMEDVSMNGVEYKKPKDTGAWLKQSDPKISKVMEVKCPDGTREKLEVMMP